ncbi:aspartic peptidase domain-containing protein [Durotheca rogersii]|uniref:aspartic peptidase domain-containing protein n=1 Tax=Durotheca rogersii TaxID=419775 RepID=UPI0022207801|nr:aspartic peptidase domain-containing protein [Durotheca rogersii]KAI5863609.1 aspartic peptidase domain-containing protein [Durotheca rogersii]
MWHPLSSSLVTISSLACAIQAPGVAKALSPHGAAGTGAGLRRGASLDAPLLHKDPARVLSMPLRRVEHRDGAGTPSLSRRFFGANVLGVYGTAYFAELTIGTGSDTRQTMDVLIDTGSFELWVNPDCSASSLPDMCEALGRYDPGASSTAQSLRSASSNNRSTTFSIRYGRGSVSGAYYTDDVYISGAKIEGQQFGVANQSSDVWFGILGLGHSQADSTSSYPLVVDSVAAQGYANSRLFSLDLGNQPDPGGKLCPIWSRCYGGTGLRRR